MTTKRSPSQRAIYRKLLRDITTLRGAVDIVETRIFELVDKIDADAARRIVKEHEEWMEED